LFIIAKTEVSQMRWLSRLLVVLIICLVAMAPPAAPAQAAGASITLSPSSGVPGEEVTVYGYNFTDNEWVDIYYCLNTACLTAARTWVAEAETDDDGYFKVEDIVIPESCTGAHKVRAYIGSSLEATKDFTVKPGLTVSPEDGPVDTNVTVEGHGFAEEEEDIELRYYLDGDYETVKKDITADEDGSWERSFPIPPSAKGDHKIDARGDTSTLSQVQDAFFEVTQGISLNKSSGSPGEKIPMTGSGFYANERDIRILFEGEEAETEIIRADDTGYWEGNFEVPEMPKGTYSVTAEGEQTKQRDISALSFEIKPGLVLSPDEGHVGTNLTVAGGGFATSKNVVIKYDGSQKATATTNNKGSFSGVSFPVPESIHGAHQVTAEDAAGNNATATFTMESTPPGTPTPNLPPDGSRVGVIGRVRPTFAWSAVSDVSGVHYSLQIARGENVTATGFADPVVTVPNIVGTNYTLEKTLNYGTYYWIVQAVDGAGNAGNWSVAYSFRAGSLPLWAFILIIVAIVVGIGAAVYFFIIRRRIYYY
jgi:hypothetical protein